MIFLIKGRGVFSLLVDFFHSSGPRSTKSLVCPFLFSPPGVLGLKHRNI